MSANQDLPDGMTSDPHDISATEWDAPTPDLDAEERVELVGASWRENGEKIEGVAIRADDEAWLSSDIFAPDLRKMV